MDDLLRNGRRAMANALVRSAGVRRRLPARAGLPSDSPPGGGVALTFDDGPDPVSTPAVLDILAARGAAATFFCVGERAVAHPRIIARMVEEGHRVGSHSSTHPQPRSLSARALHADYRRGRQQVESVLGHPEPLFRPPHGHLDGSSALVMRAAGLHPWLWNRDPRDWQPQSTTDGILAALADLQAGDVILLHDALAGSGGAPVADRRATVGAVGALVNRTYAAGLSCVTLP